MILDNTLTSCTYTDRQWELLRKHLSRCTVDNLCTRGLMIFLHCLNEYKKEFREQSVCEIVDDKISTGNIVGFVGIEENNERVELSIRYFQLLPQRPQWQLLHKKKTLPVLVPTLTYKGMGVGNGVQAYIAFINYDSDQPTFGTLKTKTERREALKRYCQQDTWAMVEILRAVREKIK